jgi:hypothetical protein
MNIAHNHMYKAYPYMEGHIACQLCDKKTPPKSKIIHQPWCPTFIAQEKQKEI